MGKNYKFVCLKTRLRTFVKRSFKTIVLSVLVNGYDTWIYTIHNSEFAGIYQPVP